MEIKFLEIAQIEFDDAISYYNYENPGLGNDLLDEVVQAINRISAFPNAWHPLSSRTRRCKVRRFPYGIIYQIRKDTILVLAVAHLHRKPDYWKNRV